ncbi:hypothetical protein ACHAWO_001185 [Cyclotella atomus]|uniref:Ig-like domain-containing protein n=1 Tax=Cyclotella atomus TaxID=382360 RepID=A0ABD3NMI2_9STRA
MTAIPVFIIATASYNALSTQAFHLQSYRTAATALKMSRPQQKQLLQSILTPVPPPPPISMPVWSLSCPIPNRQTSSMSIVTFATPVSVSCPKLWAVSLYKTSRTRCAFLGVETSGDEYNDIAATSSSVMGTTGSIRALRRRDSMRGEGMLAADEGAVGWRASQMSKRLDTSSQGVANLQLLTPSQANLVPILGKKTGWDNTYSKKTECAKELGLEQGWILTSGSTSNDHEFEVLPNCATYIQLKLKRVTDGGDHDVAICEVIGTGIWDDTSSTIKWLTETDTATQALDSATVLYTGQLRDEGII